VRRLERITLLACRLGAENFLSWIITRELGADGDDGDGDGLRALKTVAIKDCVNASGERILHTIPSLKGKLEFKETTAGDIEDKCLMEHGFYCGYGDLDYS